MAEEFPNRLTVVTSNFEVLQLEPGNYDLITGSYSLPFCQPKEFARFWAQLIKALKPGGLISVELFGVQDTWNGPGKKMTFLTRTQVDELVRDMTVVTLNEEEYDGGTFSGEQKHWHLFTLIAKARE